MDKQTAITVVVQHYSKAKEPTLSYLLDKFSVNDTTGIKVYRPFIVAALMIRSEQKTLIKADVATWEINENAYLNLLNTQKSLDCLSGLTIPDSISVSSFLTETSSNTNISIMMV